MYLCDLNDVGNLIMCYIVCYCWQVWS